MVRAVWDRAASRIRWWGLRGIGRRAGRKWDPTRSEGLVAEGGWGRLMEADGG